MLTGNLRIIINKLFQKKVFVQLLTIIKKKKKVITFFPFP